ncbi:hypothetical protein [Halobaculum magnesiiphilum]|uniref:Uncharacterized protein n=1 Tax=Halobaculum magnesiiphilum TaxID=1017351 RepID=A0A8T8WBT2_9EURY|nr:hypothetical protein [Halobaculum magnesiiphilum]QZP37332.1 hypothetical protein K6T50_13770 [Halobaculum magnesiiphilum]
MAGQSTAAEHVRETLRALAVGPPEHTGGARGDGAAREATAEQRDLVNEAERALASVEAAAAFADDDGFRRTAGVAETTVDPALARRARAVTETIERYRAAYRDAAPGGVTTSAGVADHFHSGRDRHIPTAEQPADN